MICAVNAHDCSIACAGILAVQATHGIDAGSCITNVCCGSAVSVESSHAAKARLYQQLHTDVSYSCHGVDLAHQKTAMHC